VRLESVKPRPTPRHATTNATAAPEFEPRDEVPISHAERIGAERLTLMAILPNSMSNVAEGALDRFDRGRGGRAQYSLYVSLRVVLIKRSKGFLLGWSRVRLPRRTAIGHAPGACRERQVVRQDRIINSTRCSNPGNERRQGRSFYRRLPPSALTRTARPWPAILLGAAEERAMGIRGQRREMSH
jgi:hypothetical protein